MDNDTFKQHERLIYYVLNKYYPGYKEVWEDLYQVGAIALVNCIKRYDKDKGKISTYAVESIRNEIYKEIMKIRRTDKYSSRMYYIDKFIHDNREQMTQKEMYDELKKKYPKLRTDVFNRIYYGNVSLDGIYEDDTFDIDSEERVEDEVENKDSVKAIINIIESIGLSNREKEIYYEWLKNKMYGNKGWEYRLGVKYKVSRQRISEISRKVGEKVKRAIYARYVR